ncbi:MAG: LysM peptidoglycan-binding domain-containing protein [Opitutales bacterium]|jgi:nucleoid-associated protein YgaU
MKYIVRLSLFLLALAATASQGLAQSQSDSRRLGDLEQDVLQLKAQIGQMSMSVEALQRENAALKAQLQKSQQGNVSQYATLSQLDSQISTLRAELIRAQREQKQEIIDEVSKQIERLAQQTQQALQAQAASISAAPAAPPQAVTFADNFPKTGISYTIQKGDTLSAIARRFDASVEDIRNANRITDPSRLMPGQVIFIPQKAK